jgi:Protein of unknown function (DUF1593)
MAAFLTALVCCSWLPLASLAGIATLSQQSSSDAITLSSERSSASARSARPPDNRQERRWTRPRVFISTDMQMISGINHIDGDKDDVQSLVHALMYQDRINIVGIASSTSGHQPGANDKRFIHHTIDVYARDHPKLAPRGKPGDFKTAQQLHAIVRQGTKSVVRAPRLLRPMTKVFSWAGRWGYPAATAGSHAIIREARAARAAGEKLYVVVWGGVGDVARALKDAPDIASSVRLITIAGALQEPNAYRYVVENFAGRKGFWWIDINESFRGMYATETANLPPATTLSDVEAFAKGRGHLGSFLYENSKDLRGKGDSYDGLKMGDSPSILYLIDHVDDDDPTAESWGGSYMQSRKNYWKDRTDPASSLRFPRSNGARTIYKHRAAWLGDFKARFDWLRDGAMAPILESEATVQPAGPR